MKGEDATVRKFSLIGSEARNVLRWVRSPSLDCSPQEEEIVRHTFPSKPHPTLTPSFVRVPFSFPLNSPSVVAWVHTPLGTPSQPSDQHARAPWRENGFVIAVVGTQGEGAWVGEAYCTMLTGDNPWHQDFDPFRELPLLFCLTLCVGVHHIRLLVTPAAERRAWKLARECSAKQCWC